MQPVATIAFECFFVTSGLLYGRKMVAGAEIIFPSLHQALSAGRVLVADAPKTGPLGLRAPLATEAVECVRRPCCSLQRTTPFSPSRAARASHACVLAAVCDP